MFVWFYSVKPSDIGSDGKINKLAFYSLIKDIQWRENLNSVCEGKLVIDSAIDKTNMVKAFTDSQLVFYVNSDINGVVSKYSLNGSTGEITLDIKSFEWVLDRRVPVYNTNDTVQEGWRATKAHMLNILKGLYNSSRPNSYAPWLSFDQFYRGSEAEAHVDIIHWENLWEAHGDNWGYAADPSSFLQLFRSLWCYKNTAWFKVRFDPSYGYANWRLGALDQSPVRNLINTSLGELEWARSQDQSAAVTAAAGISQNYQASDQSTEKTIRANWVYSDDNPLTHPSDMRSIFSHGILVQKQGLLDNNKTQSAAKDDLTEIIKKSFRQASDDIVIEYDNENMGVGLCVRVVDSVGGNVLMDKGYITSKEHILLPNDVWKYVYKISKNTWTATDKDRWDLLREVGEKQE